MTGEVAGEVRSTAEAGGRRLTLDPVMDRAALRVTPRRVESALPAGLRMEWMNGNATEEESPMAGFSLTCGAGVGGRYLILQIAMKDGSAIDEIIDMAEMTDRWVTAALAAGPTPKDEP